MTGLGMARCSMGLYVGTLIERDLGEIGMESQESDVSELNKRRLSWRSSCQLRLEIEARVAGICVVKKRRT
jgi:hypothetical protein